MIFDTNTYYAIITTIDLKNCWSDANVQLITDYETHFHVKLVTLFAYPYAIDGVTLAPVGATTQSGMLTLALESLPWARAVPATLLLNISGVYTYVSVHLSLQFSNLQLVIHLTSRIPQ